MYYEELQVELLKFLKDHWGRVISFDMETHVPDPDHFLTDERILSVSLARRVMEENGIEVKTLFLQKEDDDSEKELLRELDGVLSAIKPLGVVGYGLRNYDIPLLVMRKERYKPPVLWKLIDMIESAVHVDLYHLLKRKGYRKLNEALTSSEFGQLPLKRVVDIIPTDRVEKGKEIFRLWKENREELKKYSEGEVHDMLLIAEKIAFES